MSGVVEGGVVGARVGFFPADDGRGDDGVHGVVDGEVGDELGDVGVGVGDDRPLDSRFLEELGGGEDIGEDAVGMPTAVGLHLGSVDAADLGDLGGAEGDPGGLAPAAVVFQTKSLLLLAGAVADGDATVLFRVEVLGSDVGGAQHGRVGGDVEGGEGGGEALPTGWDELDQGVVKVEGDQVDRGLLACQPGDNVADGGGMCWFLIVRRCRVCLGHGWC